ncbi:MAG TPA: ABC transporter permease, partial [Clostridiaceae bacterium]|nr:ABC transporter permease [Clostridiaceae bacterium]
MKKYILKRIAISALTMLVILFILFVMLELMPGSPFNDEKLTAVQRELINIKYGLDKPVYIRFFNYLRAMLTGDFGVSYTISKNTPIADLLKTRLPISVRIGGQAVFIGTIIG